MYGKIKMDANDMQNRSTSINRGIPMGFAIGIIIGSVSGNLALWIALGCGFGAAIGSFFTMSKGKKTMPES